MACTYTSELIPFQSYQVTSYRICFSARPGPFSSVYAGPFCFLFRGEGCQSQRARPTLSRRPSQSLTSNPWLLLMLEKKCLKNCQRLAPLLGPSAPGLQRWWEKGKEGGRALKLCVVMAALIFLNIERDITDHNYVSSQLNSKEPCGAATFQLVSTGSSCKGRGKALKSTKLGWWRLLVAITLLALFWSQPLLCKILSR